MGDALIFNEESSAVQCHLSFLQGVIQRMADSSRSCKLWCITIVSATLVLSVTNVCPDFIQLAVLPTIIFLILDTYYLALERRFRCSYSNFTNKLHNRELEPSDLFKIAPIGSKYRQFFSSFLSFSIFSFYLPLILCIWFIPPFIIK